MIGVHTPEFAFEHDAGNVRRAAQAMGVGYPVAIDNDYAIWHAFDNHYWPALYFVDAQGRIRHHQFGEGEYRSRKWSSSNCWPRPERRTGQDLVSVEPGRRSAADWATLRSPENYTGYQRTEKFASPGGIRPGKPHPTPPRPARPQSVGPGG